MKRSKQGKAERKRNLEYWGKRLAQSALTHENREVTEKLFTGGVKVRIKNVARKEGGGFTIDFSTRLPRAIDGGAQADSSFDPWSATQTEALQFGGVQTPEFAAWVKAGQITANREAIESDGMALLDSVQLLMSERLRPPVWLARLFVERLRRFQVYEVATLDEAFGHEPLEERTRKAQERKRELMPQVHALLVKKVLADPSRPISIDLFEEVGERFEIGKTLCRELYDEAIAQGEQDLVKLKELLSRNGESSAERQTSPVLPKKL